MRRLFLILPVTLCVLSSGGCSFFQSQRTILDEQKSASVLTGKVIRKDRLSKGGKLLVLPFYPGVNVAADDQQDRLALRIVQGVEYILRERSPLFEFLVEKNAHDAEIVIRGKIMTLQGPARAKAWFSGRQKKILSVEGTMTDESDGAVVMVFEHTRETSRADETLDDLALMIGQDIGRFILSQVKTE